MALTSTAFMAAPGGFSATLSVKLDKIDMSQVLAAVLLADKQLLGHIKMGPAVHNIEHNFIEDELNPAYILAKSAAVTSLDCSDNYTTASLQRIVRLNALLNPAGTEQVIKVNATVTATTLTGAIYGSTTYATFSATATKCYIIGQPYADIDAASSDISMSRTKRKNFTQVFERAVEITQTRKNMAMEAVVNELTLQTQRRTMEIKRELDMAIVMGYAYASTTNVYSGDTELRTMAGIIQLIRDPNLDDTQEDTTVINAAAALTVGHINSLAYKIYDQGGLDDTADPIIVVGPNQQRVIAGFDKEYRRDVGPNERTVGYYKNVFLSDMGVEMPVVLDRWFPKDKLLILDRSRIALMPLRGDNWHLEKMAKTGRSEKWQLSGQFTIELRNADKCHGFVHGLT